ncbi:hypothetical protein EZMO1_3634 [Endozoicomonas montiporae CL-33]|uniref:Uncharacterized protein n=1 Tax=Endozoicomonas montiporae CL-33 TaxID=570277 RepID=A0A142BFT7_9GAMM|nr:hypothetical protein EZMO1_3634 [Endozoicomonas montiporae CL-33]
MAGTIFLLLLIAFSFILKNRLKPALGVFFLSYLVAVYWLQHDGFDTLSIML